MNDFNDNPLKDDEPLYNIGVVSRMTGISMANLRAWERRYNFPDAKRSDGGHRLFSERDIFMLQWVKAKIDTGMQTASAIKLFRHQEHDHEVDDSQTLNEKSSGIITDERISLKVIKTRLVEALTQKNLSAADEILGNALAFYTPEDLVLDVIIPATSDIGDGWEQKIIPVSIEHFATNYLRQRMLIWMVNSPPPKSVRPILLACAPDEWHEGSLLTMGTLLRRRRWPIAYLGQAVPLDDLAVFVKEIMPSMVVLVAMTDDAARALFELPRYFPELVQSGKPVIGFGGRVFTNYPEMRTKVTGHYLGDNFREGIKKIEKILNPSISQI